MSTSRSYLYLFIYVTLLKEVRLAPLMLIVFGEELLFSVRVKETRIEVFTIAVDRDVFSASENVSVCLLNVDDDAFIHSV